MLSFRVCFVLSGHHHFNADLDLAMNSPKKEPCPDADAIKMFVGQIPRTMEETDLKALFEEYGPVYQLNILRDKATSQSKGCCFVTFFTRKAALEAQNALHNIKVMPGMHHPIQMKPADHNESKTGIEYRKLFIGMIAKKMGETEVRLMFAPYGTIEECTVLRGTDGVSKGCAFVTYASRQMALNAIKSMHHSITMEGCSSPLVVKFADTQKEKEQKKLQQQLQSSGLWGLQNLAGVGAMTPAQYLSLLQQANQHGQLGNQLNTIQGGGLAGQTGNLNNLSMQHLAAQLASLTGATNTGGLQGLAGLGTPQQSAPSGDLSNLSLSSLASLLAATNQVPGLGSLSVSQLAALAAMTQTPGSSVAGSASNTNVNTNMSGIPGVAQHSVSSTSAQDQWREQLTNTVAGSMTGTSTLTSSLGGAQQSQQAQSGIGNGTSLGGMGMSGNTLANLASLAGSLGSSNVMGSGSSMSVVSANGSGSSDTLTQAYTGMQQYTAGFPSFTQPAVQQQIISASGKQSEGPEGCNLFIYHLPQEFSDQDLCQTFLPFGSVISAKVFIDKQTNLSKCFGFVSYDNSASAAAAIQAMNGFQIGMKRLKVQLKRSKDASKPY